MSSRITAIASVLALVGAGLIAASILIVFRFQIEVGAGQIPLARLDRWTGAVTVCTRLRDSRPPGSMPVPAPDNQTPASARLFDLAGARAAGLSDTEVTDFLAPKFGYNLAVARAAAAQAGLSPAEGDAKIADFLAAQPIPPPPAPAFAPQAFAAAAATHSPPHGGAIPLDCEAPQ